MEKECVCVYFFLFLSDDGAPRRCGGAGKTFPFSFIDVPACGGVSYAVDYHACAMQMSCSEQCVREYLKRYAHKCTRGRTPTCEDYSRVHNGGPEGCEHSDTLSYWKRVKRCCGNDCTATNSASMTSALLAQGAYKKASISIYMLLKILRANKRL